MNEPRHRIRERGISLVEVMLALVVLYVVVLAVSHTLAAGHLHLEESARQAHARQLGTDLMEEILSHGVGEAGTTTPSERNDFTSIHHYDGYEEQPGQIVDVLGTEYEQAYQRFERTVSVQEEVDFLPELGATVPGLSVTVQVGDDKGRKWTYTQFVAEGGP